MPETHPPTLPYSLRELRRYCHRLPRALPPILLNDRTVTLQRVRTDSVTGDITHGFHSHSFYEAIILLHGEAIYATDPATPGEVLAPSHALLFAPHTLHSWRVSDGTCLRLTLEFTVDPPLRIVTPAHWPSWPDVLRDVAVLFRHLAEEQPSWPLLATTRMAAILARLLTLADWPMPLPVCEEASPDIVDLVEKYLDDNLPHAFSVADVAYHVGMSERSLIRYFRQVTGETVIQHLNKMRMLRAAELLVDTDLPLTAIGVQVGIPDPSYFCSRFRQYYHTTPQRYRQHAASQPAMAATPR